MYSIYQLSVIVSFHDGWSLSNNQKYDILKFQTQVIWQTLQLVRLLHILDP